MTKVLITGASGFAGSHLVEHLNQQQVYEVQGTVFGSVLESNLAPGMNHPINLLDREAVKQLVDRTEPDWIFHLAALASPAKSFDDPRATFTNNIEAQLNVMDAARGLAKLPRILVVGSAEEYGKVAPKNLPIKEQTPLNPMSPYAVSKLTQDFLGLQYYLAYKLPIVRVRPFNHTGERQMEAFVLPAFAKQIASIEKGLQEPKISVGNLEAIRDFTDVKDMVRAYELALLKGESGEVYNIGSGRGTQIETLLQMILKRAKVPIEIYRDLEKSLPADVPQLVCEATKFTERTGWRPEYQLEQTIDRVLDYWRGKV